MEPPRVTFALLKTELDGIVECVSNAADRAQSATYEVSSTPRARAIARKRAKRLYMLASRLQNARTGYQ
jgi:hypothetical protein